MYSYYTIFLRFLHSEIESAEESDKGEDQQQETQIKGNS